LISYKFNNMSPLSADDRSARCAIAQSIGHARRDVYNTIIGACRRSRDVCSNESTAILSSDLLFLKNVWEDVCAVCPVICYFWNLTNLSELIDTVKLRKGIIISSRTLFALRIGFLFDILILKVMSVSKL